MQTEKTGAACRQRGEEKPKDRERDADRETGTVMQTETVILRGGASAI